MYIGASAQIRARAELAALEAAFRRGCDSSDHGDQRRDRRTICSNWRRPRCAAISSARTGWCRASAWRRELARTRGVGNSAAGAIRPKIRTWWTPSSAGVRANRAHSRRNRSAAASRISAAQGELPAHRLDHCRRSARIDIVAMRAARYRRARLVHPAAPARPLRRWLRENRQIAQVAAASRHLFERCTRIQVALVAHAPIKRHLAAQAVLDHVPQDALQGRKPGAAAEQQHRCVIAARTAAWAADRRNGPRDLRW